MDTPDSLSHILHEARVTKGLELSDIAEITHVRKEYLKALEEGRYADLPEDIYARNFLRLYAQAVGLDDSKLLDRYSRERRAALGITPEVSSSASPTYTPSTQETSRAWGGWIITLLLLAALAGLGYFAFSRNLFTATFPFIRLTPDNPSVVTEPTLPTPDFTESTANDSLSSEGTSEPEVILEDTETPSSSSDETSIDEAVTQTSDDTSEIATSEPVDENLDQTSTDSETATALDESTSEASSDEPVLPDALAGDEASNTSVETPSALDNPTTQNGSTNTTVLEGSEVNFTLITDPPGADASIDNYPFASRTPVFNAPVSARTARVLRIELEGYETYQELIDVTADTSLSISLKPTGASEATALNSNTPVSPLASQPSTQGKLGINIEAETWLEVYQSTTRGEGEQLVYTTVQPGETFSFDLPVYIHVGNAAGIRLNENGQDLGLFGSSGEVTGRSFGEALPETQNTDTPTESSTESTPENLQSTDEQPESPE